MEIILHGFKNGRRATVSPKAKALQVPISGYGIAVFRPSGERLQGLELWTPELAAVKFLESAATARAVFHGDVGPAGPGEAGAVGPCGCPAGPDGRDAA